MTAVLDRAREWNLSIPRYAADHPLVTRRDMEKMFREDWPDATSGDVDAYIRSHRLSPVDWHPFPNHAPVTQDMDADTRWKIITHHEQERANTMRSRELYSIASLPKFVPFSELPSENNTNSQNAAALAKIGNL